MPPSRVDGNWDNPRFQGPRVYTYPFENDKVSNYFTQEFLVRRSTYVHPPLSVPHPTLPGYYFTGDTPLTYTGVWEICRGARTYSMIPVTRTETQSRIWTPPTLTGGESTITGNQQWISVTRDSNPTTGSTIFIAPGNDFLPGEEVLIGNDQFISYARGWTEAIYNTSNSLWAPPDEGEAKSAIVTAATTTTVTVDVFYAETLRPMNMKRTTFARLSISRNYNARMTYSYYLPGVTEGVATPEDIPLQAAWDPMQDMKEGGRYSIQRMYALTTSNQYRRIEHDTTHLWKGGIYERQTIEIKPTSYLRTS